MQPLSNLIAIQYLFIFKENFIENKVLLKYANNEYKYENI